MGSRLQRALKILFGEEEQNTSTNVPQAPGVLNQEAGTLVTLERQNVDVAVVGDNDRVKVQQAGRMMGGEEIRPGTLH